MERDWNLNSDLQVLIPRCYLLNYQHIQGKVVFAFVSHLFNLGYYYVRSPHAEIILISNHWEVGDINESDLSLKSLL